MAPERRPGDIRLIGIHINLIDCVVTLDTEDGRKAKLSFGEPKILPARQPNFPSDTPDELAAEDDSAWEAMMPPASVASALEPSTAAESRERQQTVVLTGSLRTQPKAGRPDSRGRPTVWARLAVHDEGSEQDRVYSATFYRDSTAVTLGLAKGAQITVEGFPHVGDPSRKRPDRLSVIALHDYPGKVAEKPQRGVT
jgi:hypothetical protein